MATPYASTVEDQQMSSKKSETYKKKTKYKIYPPLDLDLKPVRLNDDGYPMIQPEDPSNKAFTPYFSRATIHKIVEDDEKHQINIAQHALRVSLDFAAIEVNHAMWVRKVRKVIKKYGARLKHLENRTKVLKQLLKKAIKQSEPNQP